MVSRFLKQWTWDKTILALFWSYSYLYCSGGYKIREFSFVWAAPVMHGKLVRKADKLCTWNTSILIGQLGVSCSFDWLTRVRKVLILPILFHFPCCYEQLLFSYSKQTKYTIVQISWNWFYILSKSIYLASLNRLLSIIQISWKLLIYVSTPQIINP